jgi:hypothetical protein
MPSTYSCSNFKHVSALILANSENDGSTPVPSAQGAGVLVRSYFRSAARESAS